MQVVFGFLTQLIMECQFQGTASESISPQKKLHAHLAGVAQLLQHDSSIFIALHELSVHSLRDPAAQRILAQEDQAWHDYLATVLHAGVAKQHFRADLDPSHAAWVILRFIKGLNVNMPAPRMAVAISELEAWLGG